MDQTTPMASAPAPQSNATPETIPHIGMCIRNSVVTFRQENQRGEPLARSAHSTPISNDMAGPRLVALYEHGKRISLHQTDTAEAAGDIMLGWLRPPAEPKVPGQSVRRPPDYIPEEVP